MYIWPAYWLFTKSPKNENYRFWAIGQKCKIGRSPKCEIYFSLFGLSFSFLGDLGYQMTHEGNYYWAIAENDLRRKQLWAIAQNRVNCNIIGFQNINIVQIAQI